VKDRLRPITLLALCLTEFAAQGALAVPGVVGLQLRVVTFHDRLTPESRLSWVTTVGPIAAMIATVLAGWLSDRTVRRHGHRGSWIVGGAVVGAVAVVFAAHVTTLPLLVLTWAIAQAGYGATFAGLFGAVSDIVAAVDRPRVSGWFAAGGIGGVAVGALFAALLLGKHLGSFGTSTTAFEGLAILAVPISLLTAWHLSGFSAQVSAAEPLRPAGLREVLRVMAGAGAPYWWLLLQRLSVQVAYSCLSLYAVFYVARRGIAGPADAAHTVASVTTVGAVIAMVVSAWIARGIAERIGYKATIASGIVLLGAADAVLTVATAHAAYVVANVLAGVGLGIYLALDLVVALALMRTEAAGRVLGYFNVARKLPQSLVPAIGPALLAIGSGDTVGLDRSKNYVAFFVFGCVFAVIALAVVPLLVVPARDDPSADQS
jgi:MFS family permease